jgi:putative transposase
MDNAPIHRKNKIQEVVEAQGHQVLFLPRYSPDFNDIEHDFAAMKKKRKYAPESTSVAQIVKDYSESNLSSLLI